MSGTDITQRVELALRPGEHWWGGAVADGTSMPFGAAAHTRDLAVNAGLVHDAGSAANQSAPLLVSSAGRYVWSDAPFSFSFDGSGGLTVDGADIVVGQGAPGLGGAFRAASTTHFPPTGRTPAREMLAAPQYNTWIEMPYHPTQEAVLAYVRDLLDQGFPPGLVMIDDQWSLDYGVWRYDSVRFPDPAAMAEQLHAWGCTLMVWLVPFVSPDSENFRIVEQQGLLVRGADGETAIRRWWNGYSAVLDLTHPGAVAWLRGELDALVALGVDGFKLDAGDVRDYRNGDLTAGGGGPTAQCEAWARFGAAYPFNEFRACWKMGGEPLAQRLHDKPPTWDADGLGSLIPEGIAQGLIGHPYNCPDMIGGGELGAFSRSELDQELFVRYAQCAALFPMMQFSVSPRRVLDDRHFAAVRAAVGLHQSLVPEILELADHAARTGEPILRPMAYAFAGYELVDDQFLFGDTILCAPVLERGSRSRRVVLPPGQWRDPSGAVTVGPAEVTVPVELETIPWWRLVD